MPQKGPHISISYDRLAPRVLGIPKAELDTWPEGVRGLAAQVAGELFLVRYNPFIDPEMVRTSVRERMSKILPSLSNDYADALHKAVAGFWRDFDQDQEFKDQVLERLRKLLPPEAIVSSRGSLIETATDATDLRMELPMVLLTPDSPEQVRDIVRLADEMGFHIIPRGGGTGLTGGAIPALTRTAIVSLSKLKRIEDIDEENRIICAEAGVITLTAIKAAEEHGLLFTVDPASKAGSSIGGNISENSGGPFAFEYGVTLDNIASYRMVTPKGELIEVKRRDHPRRKILEGDEASFDVYGENGEYSHTVTLSGADIRGTALGKDVSNKFLGGLPGVQKEGVDGIIVEGCFTLHPRPELSRTLCLEFFGRSMHNAMLVIKDIVALRDRIREEGDLVKISALEEFGSKYVQAISYEKKSEKYEGEPISVLLIQLDSDDEAALDEAAGTIMDIAHAFENVDVFAATSRKEAEHFWEDRHKLSAIARRTSGFKINEDIVIPLEVIPEFSDFLEGLNLHYMAVAYRRALKQATDLPGVDPGDEYVDQEFDFVKNIFRGKTTICDLSDQELEVQANYFFRHLATIYPGEADELESIRRKMGETRVMAANHMHAGDGNCHVNFPANSNDPDMLALVHEAVGKVFGKVMELGGAVSGEHGIGITKIGFLEEGKLDALRRYKAKVDPRGVINPGKLTRRELTVEPYTFSFNRLIQDLGTTALPDKERLARLLEEIQTCTRCGKCKQVCAMYHPQAGLMYHPRNKNLSLGAMVEALYYGLLQTGKPDQRLLNELRDLMEHCTACGRCLGVCPVKIDSSKVALHMRAFLDEKHSGGHPIKKRVLHFLASSPDKRLPVTAKALALGQKLNNLGLGLVPQAWRRRMENPALSGPGPELGFANLSESLKLSEAFILAPEDVQSGRDVPETVFYFPGCGAGLFYREIGMAASALLLAEGVSVILPDVHLCCGYPLLSQGLEDAYLNNYGANVAKLRKLLSKAERKGFRPQTVLTSCGTCRESLDRWGVATTFGRGVEHKDVAQYLLERLPAPMTGGAPMLYHAACHAEWTGQHPAKAGEVYRDALVEHLGTDIRLSPGCCGESGLGAMTSPKIYNRLRSKKQDQLKLDLPKVPAESPLLVGCPSCKVGIKRCLLGMEGTEGAAERQVLHTLEHLAEARLGPDWKREFVRHLRAAKPEDGLRLLEVA